MTAGGRLAAAVRVAALLVVPAAVLAAGLAIDRRRGPDWLGTNFDPSYAYLVNALRLAQGRPSALHTHPGTPVQALGALELHVLHAARGAAGNLEEDVLAHPEPFIRLATVSLLLIYVSALYAFGAAALRACGHLAYAWVAQATPLLSAGALFELAEFKPEPLLLTICALFGVLVLRTLGGRPVPALALGALCGLAVATKVNAASLAVAGLVLLPSMRGRLRFGGALALSAVVGVAPALPVLAGLGRWTWQLTTGPGMYGSGTYAQASDYVARLLQVMRAEWCFFLLMGVGAVAWLATRRASAPPVPAIRRALAAVLAVQAAQFAMLLLEPYQPRYLHPALGLAGLQAVLVASLLSALRPRREIVAGAAALAVVLGVQASGVLEQYRWIGYMRDGQLHAHAVATEHADCAHVSYYRSSTPAGAIYMAFGYGGQDYAATLQRLYPGAHFLHAGAAALVTFTDTIPFDVVAARHRCVVVQGAPGGPAQPFGALEQLDRASLPFAGPFRVATANPLEAVFVFGTSSRDLPRSSGEGQP